MLSLLTLQRGVGADMQIMVCISILVTRKSLASQKNFSETTAILSQKWTFNGNYCYFEMKIYLCEIKI